MLDELHEFRRVNRGDVVVPFDIDSRDPAEFFDDATVFPAREAPVVRRIFWLHVLK